MNRDDPGFRELIRLINSLTEAWFIYKDDADYLDDIQPYVDAIDRFMARIDPNSELSDEIYAEWKERNKDGT